MGPYHRFWHIRSEEYPGSLREQKKEIDTLLTRLGGEPGRIIPNNLQKMKNKTGSKIASLIVDMYFSLMEEQKKMGHRRSKFSEQSSAFGDHA
jgi:hypothetical protein